MTAVRAALELLAVEGVLLPDESPEHAEGLRLARRHRLVVVRRGPGGPERYHLTPRGRQWLAEGWELVSSRDVAEQRREAVRQAVESCARAGVRFDAAHVARDLGITRRRVSQIRASLEDGNA